MWQGLLRLGEGVVVDEGKDAARGHLDGGHQLLPLVGLVHGDHSDLLGLGTTNGPDELGDTGEVTRDRDDDHLLRLVLEPQPKILREGVLRGNRRDNDRDITREMGWCGRQGGVGVLFGVRPGQSRLVQVVEAGEVMSVAGYLELVIITYFRVPRTIGAAILLLAKAGWFCGNERGQEEGLSAQVKAGK